MFCSNCGKEIDNNAVICLHCGVQTAPLITQSQKGNSIAIVGLVFGCIPPFFIVGLICSIIGLVQAKKTKVHHMQALIGLILSCVFALLYISLIISVIVNPEFYMPNAEMIVNAIYFE